MLFLCRAGYITYNTGTVWPFSLFQGINMDKHKLHSFIAAAWDRRNTPGDIVATLEEYIRIPNDSPDFDPDWDRNGHMDRAVNLFTNALEKLSASWAKLGCRTDDIVVQVHSSAAAPVAGPDGKRRTPLIQVDIPAQGDAAGTVILYGHLDKQPPLDGQWSPGLGPRQPVIRDDKLYGRGGADDGYALFSSFAAVMALREQQLPHPRCVILIEACEESGSSDLEYYIRTLQASLGDVRLIVCLDSGCSNYDQLWTTDSLRGVIAGVLHIGVMRDGVHSGEASGVVPSPFRILRQLLARLEDAVTGEVLPDFLKVSIPDAVRERAEQTAAILGDGVFDHFPFLDGVQPVTDDVPTLILNRAWRSQLAVKGFDGIPPNAGSGNVMLPDLDAGLTLRVPPTLDSRKALMELKALLEKDPPYRAKVEFRSGTFGNGWAAPAGVKWLETAQQEASREYFGAPCVFNGEGGSIPFMGLLAELFPGAAFFVTGVLGPGSNAHGPDEFLHLPTAEKISMCVAHAINALANA